MYSICPFKLRSSSCDHWFNLFLDGDGTHNTPEPQDSYLTDRGLPGNATFTYADNGASLANDGPGDTYLSCDGVGDYVYSTANLNVGAESHSLSVWGRLRVLDALGGGAMSLDSRYDVNDQYSQVKFDALVYNKISNSRYLLLHLIPT